MVSLHLNTDYSPNQNENLHYCIPVRKAKENCRQEVEFIKKNKKTNFVFIHVTTLWSVLFSLNLMLFHLLPLLSWMKQLQPQIATWPGSIRKTVNTLLLWHKITLNSLLRFQHQYQWLTGSKGLGFTSNSFNYKNQWTAGAEPGERKWTRPNWHFVCVIKIVQAMLYIHKTPKLAK